MGIQVNPMRTRTVDRRRAFRVVGYGRVLALVSANDAVDEHVAHSRDCGGIKVAVGEDR